MCKIPQGNTSSMIAVINILCLAFGFFITWKLFRDRLGIKKLGVICVALILGFSLVYLFAKSFAVGFVLLPSQTALAEPENAMSMSLAIIKVALVFFPLCYVFEWWYYRKNPDIDPYTGKKKEPAENDES